MNYKQASSEIQYTLDFILMNEGALEQFMKLLLNKILKKSAHYSKTLINSILFLKSKKFSRIYISYSPFVGPHNAR